MGRTVVLDFWRINEASGVSLALGWDGKAMVALLILSVIKDRPNACFCVSQPISFSPLSTPSLPSDSREGRSVTSVSVVSSIILCPVNRISGSTALPDSEDRAMASS
ncbi:hypothetical protein D3C81_1486600 [compost metagenome]